MSDDAHQNATRQDLSNALETVRTWAPRAYATIDMRDLTRLVQGALRAEYISIDKAAQLLGLSTDEMRALTRVWAEKRPAPRRSDFDLEFMWCLVCKETVTYERVSTTEPAYKCMGCGSMSNSPMRTP